MTRRTQRGAAEPPSFFRKQLWALSQSTKYPTFPTSRGRIESVAVKMNISAGRARTLVPRTFLRWHGERFDACRMGSIDSRI